jgi:hypothetical protein
MYYIYSTMTAGVNYTFFTRNTSPQGGVNQIRKVIKINGGANLPTKMLVTPRGSVTTIPDEDYELLKNHLTFKQHLASGHVSVERVKVKIDKAVANMVAKDGSAPKVASDFKEPPKSVGKLDEVYPGIV